MKPTAPGKNPAKVKAGQAYQSVEQQAMRIARKLERGELTPYQVGVIDATIGARLREGRGSKI